MQRHLDSASLGSLDEGAAKLIMDQAILEAVRDLDDRGEDGKPRVVNIVVTMKRMDNGLVEAHVEAEAKIPKRRTASTIASLRHDAGQSKLLFQEYARGDPHQRTIDEAGGEIRNS